MHATFLKATPNSVETLTAYRHHIDLALPFNPTYAPQGDAKTTLQKAIHEIFDANSARSLDLHLDSFLKHIAKTEAELFDLLQLAAASSSVVSLTERALTSADEAYLTSSYPRHDCKSVPEEVLKLPKDGRLEIYQSLHRTSDVEATICLTAESFLPSASNYRSYRLHAAAGPRMRRDCELVCAKISHFPWAIATRGYFLPFRYVIHCRTPFIDSDVSIRQQVQLREAYVSALELAKECGVETIEIPMVTALGSNSTYRKIRRTILEAIHAAQNVTGFKRACLIGCTSG